MRCDGNSINVRWEDGPTAAQVHEIADRFKRGNFDGMTDSYTHGRYVWPSLFGGANYVFSRREYSDGLLERAIANVAAECGLPASEALPTMAEFREGQLWNRHPRCGDGYHDSWQQRIHGKAAEMEG